MTWPGFAALFVAFFATHSVPLRPQVKARLVAVLGGRGFSVSYSVLSTVMLAWLILAAADAPYVALWTQAPWQKYVTLAGMGAVCLLVALTAGRPNPFSSGGLHNDRFDPKRPGLVRWTRHPLLLALGLWSGLHLLLNGDLVHVILFGVFMGFSVLGMKIVDRRKRRLMGEERWTAMREAVANSPRFAVPHSWAGLGLRVIAGVAAFLVLLMLHPAVLGVSPLPEALF